MSKEILDKSNICDQFLRKVSTELKTADGTQLQVYSQTEITSLWEIQHLL